MKLYIPSSRKAVYFSTLPGNWRCVLVTSGLCFGKARHDVEFMVKKVG